MIGYGLLFHGYFNWSQCSDFDNSQVSPYSLSLNIISQPSWTIFVRFLRCFAHRPSHSAAALLNTSSRVPFRSLLKVSVQFSQINPLCGILGYGNGAEIALTWEETLHIIRATLEKNIKELPWKLWKRPSPRSPSLL